jgi:hypothetical protein
MEELTLEQKIFKCDTEVINYIKALESENLKLQKKMAKLQAQMTTLKNRNKILKEYEDRHNAITSLSDEELDEELKKLENDKNKP